MERTTAGADLAGDVAALKKRYSGDLLLYGIGELANYLAHQNLVDEVRFWIHPYIGGDGVRPFHAGELPLRLRLIGDDIRIRHGEAGIPADGWIDRQGLTCGCRKEKVGQASQPDLLLLIVYENESRRSIAHSLAIGLAPYAAGGISAQSPQSLRSNRRALIFRPGATYSLLDRNRHDAHRGAGDECGVLAEFAHVSAQLS